MTTPPVGRSPLIAHGVPHLVLLFLKFNKGSATLAEMIEFSPKFRRIDHSLKRLVQMGYARLDGDRLFLLPAGDEALVDLVRRRMSRPLRDADLDDLDYAS